MNQPKPPIAQRREDNLRQGRPARAGFPWRDGELDGLLEAYGRGISVDRLAERLERQVSDIVRQLTQAGVMGAERSAGHEQIPATKSAPSGSQPASKSKPMGNRRGATPLPQDGTAAMHEGLRRKVRPLVVDDAPGPKYDEMIRRFGAVGDQD